ncbi:hypothetical protein AWZ03_004351 [Drosophila navojoa]|uniref:Uncharacterized protein n=1 Tax=Drosophila navojoa TaxID=7232 RepID=A0A484BM34_DRONA|nr:hypothetical protein AWZ03_004351 [Drosophila navojoa]
MRVKLTACLEASHSHSSSSKLGQQPDSQTAAATLCSLNAVTAAAAVAAAAVAAAAAGVAKVPSGNTHMQLKSFAGTAFGINDDAATDDDNVTQWQLELTTIKQQQQQQQQLLQPQHQQQQQQQQ